MANERYQQRIMKDVTDYISKKDADKIIEVTENLRDRLLFTWLFRSGRRISEITRSVKRKDINVDEKTITYHIKKKKDENFMVTLPIDDETFGMIMKWIEIDQIGMEHWIINISRQRADQLIKIYARKIGLSTAHCHQLRHGFAVHGIKSGVDLRTVQKMLQHSDMGTTAFYLQFTTEDIREASKKMWN